MSRVQTLYELQMIGTAVFAVTGVLAVNRRGLDAFGGIVLGTVTSLGGGTIRDVVKGFIFCMRAAAIHWHLQMPVWLTNRDDLA